MSAVWRDPLWWRYRIGNPLLATLPLAWQYRIAERWGQRRPHTAADAASIRRGLLALGAIDGESQAHAVLRRYHGLQSRIRLDDHRMATVAIPDVLAQVRLHGAEVITQKAAARRGLIILTAHCGRLGMVGPALRRLGLKSAFLSATVDGRATGLSAMQRWVGYRNGQSLQRFTQGDWIMADDPATRLRAVLRRGELLIAVLDGLSTRSTERAEFRFLSGVIRIPTGIVRLSHMTGAPMVFALLHDLGNEYVELRCWDLLQDPREAVQQAFDILSCAVRKEPWQWWFLPNVLDFWRPLQ